MDKTKGWSKLSSSNTSRELSIYFNTSSVMAITSHKD